MSDVIRRMNYYDDNPSTPRWWTPATAEIEKDFKTMKDEVKYTLLVHKDGVPVTKLRHSVSDQVEEPLPYYKFGFKNLGEMLFHMSDLFDVRKFDSNTQWRVNQSGGKADMLFLFLKESSVSKETNHIRNFVEHQASDKKKKTPRATSRNTIRLQPEALLHSWPSSYAKYSQGIQRPDFSSAGPSNSNRSPRFASGSGRNIGLNRSTYAKRTQVALSNLNAKRMSHISYFPAISNNWRSLTSNGMASSSNSGYPTPSSMTVLPLMQVSSVTDGRPRIRPTHDLASFIAKKPSVAAESSSGIATAASSSVSTGNMEFGNKRTVSQGYDDVDSTQQLRLKKPYVTHNLENFIQKPKPPNFSQEGNSSSSLQIRSGGSYASNQASEEVQKLKTSALPRGLPKPQKGNLDVVARDNGNLAVAEYMGEEDFSDSDPGVMETAQTHKDTYSVPKFNSNVGNDLIKRFDDITISEIKQPTYAGPRTYPTSTDVTSRKVLELQPPRRKREPERSSVSEKFGFINMVDYTKPPPDELFFDPSGSIEFEKIARGDTRKFKIVEYNSSADLTITNAELAAMKELKELTRSLTGLYRLAASFMPKVEKLLDQGIYCGYSTKTKQCFRIQIDLDEDAEVGKICGFLCDFGRFESFEKEHIYFLKELHTKLPRQCFVAETDFAKAKAPNSEYDLKDSYKLNEIYKTSVGKTFEMEICNIATEVSVIPFLRVKIMQEVHQVEVN